MINNKETLVKNRRLFLQSAGLGIVGLLSMNSKTWAAAMETLSAGNEFANGQREMIAYPQKRKLMRITTRPPHLETPFEVFNEGVITPNDAFFVRYHLANTPLSIDPDTYRLTITGHVDNTLSLSLA